MRHTEKLDTICFFFLNFLMVDLIINFVINLTGLRIIM